ncbi:MAG: TraX family protein [Candidatus Izemoplasmatales bacterium]
MSGKTLKIIALITMTIDHIGLYLLPADTILYTICRCIGRVAFPLFSFMVAEGFHHSHNVKKYFLRLFGYCLIIEIGVLIYYLISGVNHLFTFNVIWPLAFGLLSLILLKRNEWYLRVSVIIILIGSELLRMPYGAYGIGIVIIFGVYRQFLPQALMVIALNILFLDWPFLELIGRGDLAKFEYLQWFSVLALLPVYFYNGKPGAYRKWFFYVYYPAHLGIILLLSLWI